VTISGTVIFDEGCGSFSKLETVHTQNERVDLQVSAQIIDVQHPCDRNDADVETEVQETAIKEMTEVVGRQ
jgi:hypothetical protein